MPVAQGDLSFKRPTTSNDVAAQNGGRLTDTALPTAVFPDVTGAERDAGITRYRKVFFKNEAGIGVAPLKYSDATLSLLAGKVFLENISAADDYYMVKAGTPTDVQSGVGATGWAGTGYLEADVLAAVTTLQIRCEIAGSAGEIFQCTSADAINRTVVISEYANGTGNREFIVLDQTTGVSWGTGGDINLATLTFTSTPLMNAYTRSALTAPGYVTATSFSSTTIGCSTLAMVADEHIGRRVRIMSGTGAGQIRRIVDNNVTTIWVEHAWTTTPDGTSVFEVLKTYGCMCVGLGDVKCSYSGVVATTAGDGDFVAEGNLKLFPIGCRDDTWTCLFSSPTAYTISGSNHGQVAGSFNTSAVCRPQIGASYLFEINPAGWTGTWASGDTLVFNTISASKAFWIKEVVPDTANPHLANSIDIGATGDTV